MAVRIDPVDLEYAFRQIDADRSDNHGWTLLLRGEGLPTPSFCDVCQKQGASIPLTGCEPTAAGQIGGASC